MQHDAAAPTTCLNCGAAIDGAFCARCGQKAEPLNPSLGELLHEISHEISHVDGKTIQSVRFLLTRPGFLSREYVEGRRARYIPPIRLYLLCSVLYFAIVAVFPLQGPRVGCPTCPPERRADVEREMREAVAHWTPRAMFLLVPVFAGLVALAAGGPPRNYPQHLCFAMHVHAAWFLAGVAAVLAGIVTIPYVTPVVSGAAMLYGVLYFVLAFRFMYHATPVRSVVGPIAVGATYLMIVIMTLLAIVLTVAARAARG